MTLAEKIKQLRKEKKFSNTEMSETLNWPISKLSKIESGTQKITVEELKDICEVLTIDPAMIIGSEFESKNLYRTTVEDELRETLKLAATKYPLTEDERKNFAGSEVGKIITKKLPLVIEQKANINLKSSFNIIQ